MFDSSQPEIDGIHPVQQPGREKSQLVCPARFRTRAGAVEKAVNITKNFKAKRYAAAALTFALGIVNIVFICYRFLTRPERDPDEHLNLSRLIAVYTEFFYAGCFLFLALMLWLVGVCCPTNPCNPNLKAGEMPDVEGRIIDDLNATGNFPHMDPRDYSKGLGATRAITMLTGAMDFSLFKGIEQMNYGSLVRQKKHIENVLNNNCDGVPCFFKCYFYSSIVFSLFMTYLLSTAAVVVKLAEVGSLVAEFQLGDMTVWQVFSVVGLLNQASVRALLPASHACSSPGLLRASILVARPG